jgi:hypothetical protein
MAGDALRHSALPRNQPEVAAVAEGDFIFGNVREAQQPAFRQALRNCNRGNAQNKNGENGTRRHERLPPQRQNITL